MSPVVPTAATITVRQTLELLDGSCSELANNIANRRYVLWLGSGISRGRVDDLLSVIRRVLAHIQDKADFSNPNCKYRRALNDAITLAQLSAEERMDFDPTQPLADWKLLPTILDRLRNCYARLLDIRIDDEPEDYVLWNAVDVVGTFADAGVEPDCEHICIAILVIEGLIANIASANWDGLIESAVDKLTEGSTNILRVCVRPEDFREHDSKARLMKFHGCAVRAKHDPTIYRPLLVARQSQIMNWRYAAEWKVMRQKLVDLATTGRTLMVGLSAQDTNIQDVFLEGENTMPWSWPTHPPAYVFAEEVLGQDQGALLKCVYRDAYMANRDAIEQGARIRAFAKPLLTALVLYCLWLKLVTLARRAPTKYLEIGDFDALGEGLRHLRDRVAATVEPDRLAFIRALVCTSARALSLFREGRLPNTGATSYRPLGIESVNQIANAPDMVTSGLPEFAVALGLLGLGEQVGNWTITLSDSTKRDAGVLQATPIGGTGQKIFFAANSDAALQLYINGIVHDDEANAVIVHSMAPTTRLPRSPRGAPGRTGAVRTREVGIRSLLRDTATLADLQRQFREEAIL